MPTRPPCVASPLISRRCRTENEFQLIDQKQIDFVKVLRNRIVRIRTIASAWAAENHGERRRRTLETFGGNLISFNYETKVTN